MDKTTNMISYINGNYKVWLDLNDGTMVRYSPEDELKPQFPDSMDIKITNCCDGINGHVCSWCHEKSTPKGQHGDIMSESFIDKLHPYTQLALGGGNVLLHPDFEDFLFKCQDLRLVPSITVHQEHFIQHAWGIHTLCKHKLIYGLGVSLTEPTEKFLNYISDFPTAVIHVIAGVNTVEQLRQMANRHLKILILGYKTFGRGIEYGSKYQNSIAANIKELNQALPQMIEEKWFDNISFDNLALKQLDIKSLLSPEQWERFYMGKDGTSTMYVDMVNREFAKSSTSSKRYPLLDNIEDMLEVIHREEG